MTPRQEAGGRSAAHPTAQRPDVIVVGAGFAGVAAATALAEQGARVMVLETRQRPGGRAYSWADPKTGEVFDNGQHVLASFYDETLRLLERLGTTGALEADPTFRMRFWERGRGEFELRCPDLPAPFHWLAAVGGCPRFSAAARVTAVTLHPRAKALLAAANGNGDATVATWLDQGPGSDDLAAVLGPVALAALNERPEEGSAVLFARVLDRLFAAPAPKSGLALPRRGLGDLIEGFEEYLEARGGSVWYRATVLGVRIESGRATGVSLLGGDRVQSGAVVLTVPHERVPWLLRPEFAAPYAAVAATPWSPIVSTVHVFDRSILPSRFVGMVGTETQWAFDRGTANRGPAGALAGADAGTSGAGHAVGTVRSAAFSDAERDPHAIADATTADLREAFAPAREAVLIGSRVYKERRATMRATPAVQPLRPSTITAVERLFLAGDWTDTGLPPTIESAVLSGHRAAEAAKSR
jgi:zeta-carotene desaturase